MKIIKLKGVHYLSYNGITLTLNQPYVEATEENIKKLSEYINAGFLVLKNKDEEDSENKFHQEDVSLEEKAFYNNPENNEIDKTLVQKYPTEEELDSWTKKELIEFLKEHCIKYKPSMNKEELIQLILA